MRSDSLSLGEHSLSSSEGTWEFIFMLRFNSKLNEVFTCLLIDLSTIYFFNRAPDWIVFPCQSVQLAAGPLRRELVNA